MATRQVLAELADAWERRSGTRTEIESVGGVDAARRVMAGEAFDVVFLASDAIDKLVAGGRLVPGSRVDLVDSSVAIAVRAGTPRPDIATEDALRAAVQAAPTIGYSTGPSGVALLKLFERWGLAAELAGKTVQAAPGVPVGKLVAQGEVALGFQQLSELMSLPGIDVIGPMPAPVEITTTFSAGVCESSAQAEAVRGLLGFMASPDADETKRRNGMKPASPRTCP